MKKFKTNVRKSTALCLLLQLKKKKKDLSPKLLQLILKLN